MLKIINTAVLIVAVCSSLVHAETRSEKRANDVKARKEVASQLDRTAQTIKNNLQQSALTTQSDFTTIQAEVHKQKAQVKDMKTKILLKTAAPTNTDCWHAIVAKVNKYDASPELKAQYAQRMYMQLATVTKGDGGYKALEGS